MLLRRTSGLEVGEVLDFAGGIADFFFLDACYIEHVEEEIGHGRALGVLDVPTTLDAACAVAGEDRRKVEVFVLVAVGKAAAVEDDRVVEQRALTVASLVELGDEVAEHLDMVLVDLLQALDLG